MELIDLPEASDPLVGAGCTLGREELKRRLADWRGLRDAAESVEVAGDTVRLRVAPTAAETLEEALRLAALESECCPFYRFTLRVDGPRRELEIDGGSGRRAAVEALLALPG